MNYHGDIEQYAYPDLTPLDQDWRWCHRYCYDIVKKNIPHCEKMKWTAIRHFKDLERNDIYFCEESANSIVKWFKFCPIVKGRHSGSPTVLDPSQIFILVSVIAWKWKDDKFELDDDTGQVIQVRFKGFRRYNQMYAQVSRKYGKTTLAAGLMLYLMFKSGFGAKAYSLATKKDQAKEIFTRARDMISLSPRLQTVFEARANDIRLINKSSEFKALASDSNSLDGLDPIAGCLDECHAISDRNLYGVLVSAFGGNEGGQFLFVVITTAGFILQGLCTDLYQNGTEVLNPDSKVTQDNYFYAIFEIDKDDEWSDEQAWKKSNPSLIYGRPSINYLRDRYQEACLSVSEKANFLTKHCNIFVNGTDKWLNIDMVNKCKRELDINDYKHKKAYLAIDRSMVLDLTSISILFPDSDGGCTVFLDNLTCQRALDEAGTLLSSVYQKALDEKDLVIVGYGRVEKKNISSRLQYWMDFLDNCDSIFYDPYGMGEMALELEQEGINMVSVSQGFSNMSEPSKNLEGMISDEAFRYNKSILFEYACSCAVVSPNKYGNQIVHRVSGREAIDKIDPLISVIINLSGATLTKEDRNVYEGRGLLTI